MTRNGKIRLNFLRTAIVGAVFYGSAAAAEEIPEEMLLMDYANCMQGCLAYEGQTACEILCGCSMSRFRSELDLEAYDILAREMIRDEVSPENRAFLDQTGQICVAEMDRIMEQFALEAPPEDRLPPPEDGEEENP
jgi:hypothetical protein